MFEISIMAENIKKYRKIRRLTQTDLANKMFLTPQTVSKWENGVTAPDLSNLCNLAQILGVSVNKLLGVSGNADDNLKNMIGIDGGGTKTEFVLFKENGVVVRRISLGGSNPNALGMENACEVLKSGIDRLLFEADGNIEGIFAGIAGTSILSNREKILLFLKKQYSRTKIFGGSDIQNVFSSVRGIGKCSAIICGTGFVVYANDGNTLHRAGGYGYLLDGAGSGYDIGHDVLQACLRKDDGIEEISPLIELAEKKIGGRVIDKLDLVYSKGSNYIASFAPIAFEALSMGDDLAQKIICDNFSHILSMIHYVQSKYDCGNKVIAAGGLTAYPEIFKKYISDGSDIEIIFPKFPPVYGACIKCAELCGLNKNIDEFDKNFENTMLE